MRERSTVADVVIRPGGPEDIEPAFAVWLAANTARRDGLPPRPEQEARARGHVRNPGAFLLVAENAGEIVGMALGEQARSNEGTGPPVGGLCHVSMVFVAPDHWGQGLGGRLVDALLAEARSRSFDRAQLWTQADNPRAMRVYERRGFRVSGRQKEEFGELIVHYQRALSEIT
jgi:ribosomal protein S18 acetylase RimI-like enzyme